LREYASWTVAVKAWRQTTVRSRLAALGGADECVRPYITRTNAVFGQSTKNTAPKLRGERELIKLPTLMRDACFFGAMEAAHGIEKRVQCARSSS